MTLDPARVVRELRELHELTGDGSGAQRVAWSKTWQAAREWLADKLDALPVEQEIDEAGNQWATLRGRSRRSLLIGGHLDSVPNGGWLDGCLNVVAGLEIMRRLVTDAQPVLTVRLVSWADEEGARFGRSLFGSAAATGLLEERLRGFRDRDGIALPDALAAYGVNLDRAGDSSRMLNDACGYLELHIEQGPVLEALDLPLGVVTGTFGVERHLVTFTGQAAHSGSTPIDMRHDPVCAAARLTLAIRASARREGGVGTVGRINAEPGTATAVAGTCAVTVDQRHLDPGSLARMLQGVRASSERIATEERVEVRWEPVFRASPQTFDPQLIAICEEAAKAVSGSCHRLPSGPLHDATSVAGSGIPTGMIFVQSLGGLSHTNAEDTRAEHLELAVRALDLAVERTLESLGFDVESTASA